MKKVRRLSVRLQPGAICLSLAACVALAAGCHKAAINNQDLRNFEQVNLVADKSAWNPALVDPTLKDAWGLAWAPSGIAWVNATVDGVSELYTVAPAVAKPRAAVNIPSPTDSVGGAPIGVVFNSTKGFPLPDKSNAAFIFDGGDGVISAWNGGAGNNAFRVANNWQTASYTGLTLASSGGANFLYAANFKSGKIEVWDTAWNPVTWMPFHDPAIPAGFANFNIQSVGNWLLVTYAKVGANGRQAVGAGLGFVDVFNTDGSFVRRLASRGWLNSPWGVTMAAASFLQQEDMDEKGGPGGSNGNSGSNGGHDFNDNQPVILVGNFGDGRINVFSLDGQFLGQLRSHNQVITINGLWALGFAPTTATSISQSWLFFTAGPDMEADGVFGYLIKN
jgi:uncharacterized protein (TIGR03118 family)